MGNINGRNFSGDNISVNGDDITIDGKSVNFGKSTEPIKVIVHGNVHELNCHNAEITGDVYGNVETHNLTCDTIGSDVDAHNVKTKK